MGSGLADIGGLAGLGSLFGGAGQVAGALGAGGQSQQAFTTQMHPTQLKAALKLLNASGTPSGESISQSKKALNAVTQGYAGAAKNLALGASNAKQSVLDQQTQALGAQNAMNAQSGMSGLSTAKQGVGQISGNTAKTLADIDNTIANQQAMLSVGAAQAKAHGLENIGAAYDNFATSKSNLGINKANAVANTIHKDHYDALGNLKKSGKPKKLTSWDEIKKYY